MTFFWFHSHIFECKTFPYTEKLRIRPMLFLLNRGILLVHAGDSVWVCFVLKQIYLCSCVLYKIFNYISWISLTVQLSMLNTFPNYLENIEKIIKLLYLIVCYWAFLHRDSWLFAISIFTSI